MSAFFESQLGISVNQGEAESLFSLSDGLLSVLEGSYASSPTSKTRSDSADNSVKAPPVMSQTRANTGNNPLFHSRTPQQRAAMMINPDAPSLRPPNDTESSTVPPRPTVRQISEEIRRSNSEEVAIGYREVYNIPPAVKYMPVDMITTPAVKKSIARSLLYSALKNGMTVIKHGRQGKPKKRILTCDPNVTVLFWLAENEENDVDSVLEAKSFNLSDVIEIREGTDIDPETSSTALTAAAANGIISPDKLMELVKAKEELKNASDTPTKKTAGGKQNLFESIFGSKEKEGILLGTSTLRKNCKAEDFKLCFSLILPDRTFDIQFLQKADYDTLFINLREILQSGGTGAGGSNGNSLYHTWSFNAPSPMNNPLKKKPSLVPQKAGGMSPKKSVRFLDTGADNKDSSDSFMRTKTIPSASSLTDSMHSAGEYSTSNSEVIEMGPDGSNLDLLLQRGNHPSVLSADSYDAYENSSVANQRKMSSLRMSSTEAIQIGIMLADQEKKYGTNMYESLTKEDEPLVENHVKNGYTTEEAILMVFEDKYENPGEAKVAILPRKESLMNNADSKVFTPFPSSISCFLLFFRTLLLDALLLSFLIYCKEKAHIDPWMKNLVNIFQTRKRLVRLFLRGHL
jgi:hypothetical protein